MISDGIIMIVEPALLLLSSGSGILMHNQIDNVGFANSPCTGLVVFKHAANQAEINFSSIFGP
jgi:hypothetical protein